MLTELYTRYAPCAKTTFTTLGRGHGRIATKGTAEMYSALWEQEESSDSRLGCVPHTTNTRGRRETAVVTWYSAALGAVVFDDTFERSVFA